MSIVEDKGFLNFLKVLDPKYTPPSRRTIMRDHLPSLYETKKGELKQKLEKVDYLSLTTDLWTSRATMGYITVTCHFITEEWVLQSAVLETAHVDEAHTSVNLASILKQITDRWEITDKVCCVVTDNASNIKGAIRIHKWNHLSCFAHTLNLIVSDSLRDTDEVASVIKLIKNIVSYFHKSSKASDKLGIIQARLNLPHHKLIQDVDTRWNSVFYMLERYLEQEEAIQTTLCLLGRTDLVVPTEQNLLVSETISILRPFEVVTREISAEKYISASKIIPLSKALQRLTTSYTGSVSALCNKLTTNMRDRFLYMEENTIIASPTLLDPRFKKLAFTDKTAAERSSRSIIAEVATTYNDAGDSGESTNESTASISDNPIWNVFDQTVADVRSSRLPTTASLTEVQQYLRIPNIDRHDDPLQWWKDNIATLSKMEKTVRKYLTILATSVPSERLFSKAGELVSTKRSSIKPKNVNMLLFLNKVE